MKINKKVIETLEQFYSSSNLSTLSSKQDPDTDVPNITDNQEYKTNVSVEDIEEPVIKTKKGKTILREPPNTDENNFIKDIKIVDKTGKKIKNFDPEIYDLDRSEIEEMIDVLDEETILEKNTNKSKTKEIDQDEDSNGMEDLAQSNMGEQNPNSGKDSNDQQGLENPDPSKMTAGISNDPTQEDPTASTGMTGLGGIGSDQSIDPLTGEPKHTSQEVGRIFELKKIYSRLLSIESQLSFSSDIVLLKLRKFVSDAIELFETLISNIDAFKNEVDEIIVMYYDFLEEIYEILKKYYKNKQNEDQKEQNKKNSKSLP